MQERQLNTYWEKGYLLLESLVPRALIDRINADVDRVVARARELTQSDDVLDLEDSHTPETPRVRRLKYPNRHCPTIDEIFDDPGFKAATTAILGPNVRIQTTKLNLKEAGYGAAVEWHQDWGFYQYTNDDVTAAGILLDDVEHDNGPLMVLDGTHRGPVLDHSYNGVFCGAIDTEAEGLPVADATALTGPAGSVSFHHARIVHGSDVNRSQERRRILFIEMVAADAWPLAGSHAPYTDLEEFNSRIVYGEPTLQPRMEALPLRMPLPRPAKAASLYEVQSGMMKRAFGTAS